MYVESGDAYFTTGNIEVENELKVQGLLYVGGNATVGKLATESNAKSISKVICSVLKTRIYR